MHNKAFWITASFGVILVVLFLLYMMGGSNNDYKAVFLNNEQVYFGHISSTLNPLYLTIDDVYYFSATQKEGQQGEKIGDLFLTKLGSGELHQPTSSLKINKDTIVFIEDLQLTSPILKAIQKLQ